MKKVKILLSAAAVVAIIAGAMATKARQSVITYLPVNPQDELCSVTVHNLDFVASPSGPDRATKIFNAPCQKGLTFTPSQD